MIMFPLPAFFRGGPRKAAKLSILLLLGCSASSFAQMSSQTISLSPGWNAVYTEVHPASNKCDTIFAGVPVETVWAWNRAFERVFTITGITTNLLPNVPDWLAYYPPNHVLRDKQSLFSLIGGKCYLVKLANTAAPTNIVLRGRPAIRPPKWTGQSFNLVGFTLDRSNPPTFTNFFSASDAHTNVARLRPDGSWQTLPRDGTRMTNGEAFWVYVTKPSDFPGPIRLALPQVDQLAFGTTLQEQTFRIGNSLTNRFTTNRVRLLASQDPNRAGELPIDYWVASFTTNGSPALSWITWTNELPLIVLGPGEESEVRLAIRRKDFVVTNSAGSNFQALIEITETRGSSRWLVPVSAESPDRVQSFSSGFAPMKAAQQVHPKAGLWAGSVDLNLVTEPANPPNDLTPVPVAFPFHFRLLLHVNGSGQASLLQKVILVGTNGTTKPDPTDPTGSFVTTDQSANYLLLTDESLVRPPFVGITLKDGQLVGRRYSTTAFSFKRPVPMTGFGFGTAGNVFSCNILNTSTNSLNPFRHAFHPDHNNLDEQQQPLSTDEEVFAFTRGLTLTFSATDPNNLPLAGFGDDQLGGIYEELISGLHRTPVKVRGTFRITRVAKVNELINAP
jgi:hypothetical protein